MYGAQSQHIRKKACFRRLQSQEVRNPTAVLIVTHIWPIVTNMCDNKHTGKYMVLKRKFGLPSIILR